MRVCGLVGLVIALLVVGWLAKAQLQPVTAPPRIDSRAAAAATATATATSEQSVHELSQQTQRQIKEAVDAAMRQPRATTPDE